MATYVTKKCPYCGFIYQLYKSGEQRRYGCPYRTCEKCGNHYWDTYYVEPALHGYKNAYETRKKIGDILTLICVVPVALITLVGAVFFLVDGDLVGLGLLVVSAFMWWPVCSYVKNKIDDKRNWNDIVKKRCLDYDESMRRLKDTNYLVALAQYDKRARKLLEEREKGVMEHYAERPEL